MAYKPPSDTERSEVDHVMSSDGEAKLYSGTDVKLGQLRCLQPGGWVNDDAMNEHVKLLNLRQRELEGADRHFPTVLYANTRLYTHLTRWTCRCPFGSPGLPRLLSVLQFFDANVCNTCGNSFDVEWREPH